MSDVPDGELGSGDTVDTAKPKAPRKRKGKARKADAASTVTAEKADAASAEPVDVDAAQAEFFAQFPTTDPDAVEIATTPVDDVTSKTDDSETAKDTAAVADDVSADSKVEVAETAEVGETEAGRTETDTEAAAPEAGEASEADVAASPDADDVKAEAVEAETDIADNERAEDTPAEAESKAAEPDTDAESLERTVTPAPVAAAALDPDVDGTDDPDELLLQEFEDDDDDISSWVRPYVWTGGRTETTTDFAIETLVSAREQVSGTDDAMRDEHRRVLELCEEPRSVTEIAALLSVPLGVAKTLLGAMVEEDLVVVHRNNGSAAGPDLALMERVLRGLKKL